MGDENGLFILVKHGRIWYPQTGIPAGINFGGITISQLYTLQAEVKAKLFARNDLDSDLEQIFIASWDKVVSFYREIVDKPQWVYLKPMLPFIQLLRNAGYNKRLRAETSHENFLLRRYRNYNSRIEHPALMCALSREGHMNVGFRPDTGIPIPHTPLSVNISCSLKLEKPELTDELEGLLMRVMMQPID